MKITSAEFVKSVVKNEDILLNTQNEFALVGRSNVGKSSLINLITNNKNMAKTSSTPGFTKHINYFKLNNGKFYLVDLPGYGYHKAGKSEEEKWSKLLEHYLLNSKNLKCVFVLLDSRHLPSENDKIMYNFLNYYRINYVTVLTKTDKLSKNELNKMVKGITNSLALTPNNVVVTSAIKKEGVNEILKKMDAYM